jgi:hypothetical protein
MKRLLFPAAACVLLAGFLLWWFSPGQVLKRRTLVLLEALTLDKGAGLSSRQLGVYSLNALLAPEVTLENTAINEANGSFERSELESTFSWLCQQAKQTRFELKDLESVSVSGDAGEVSCTLEALVELPAYRPADGIFRANFHWRRGDDGWRLESARWADVAH